MSVGLRQWLQAGLAAAFVPMPSAVVVEPVKGPWTNSPQWGNSLDARLPLSAGTVLSVFETADIPGPPRPLVVNLFRSDVQNETAFNAQMRARITYGIGAKQNQFDCDWTQGAQFTVVANYVRVNGVSYRPSLTADYDAALATKSIVLGAGVAIGNAAKVRGLTYTYARKDIDNVPGPGSGYTVNVPDFAQALVLHARIAATDAPIVAGDVQVIFLAGAQRLAVWDGLAVQAHAGNGLYLPGGTTAVAIQTTLAAPKAITPQFVLSL